MRKEIWAAFNIIHPQLNDLKVGFCCKKLGDEAETAFWTISHNYTGSEKNLKGNKDIGDEIQQLER